MGTKLREQPELRLTPRGRRVIELTVVTLVLVVTCGFMLWALHRELTRELDSPSGTIPPVSITCEEDMPCWDCHTMGNGRCGP